MIVDLENHFVTEAWISALHDNDGFPRLESDSETGALTLHYHEDTSLPLGLIDKLLDLGPGRLATLDAAGIDVAVLSQATPGVECLDPEIGTPLARRTNDALAEAVARYPDRFQGFAAIAPKNVDSAVAELERAVKELGFKGWHTLSNFGDSYLDEKRYWPILAKAEELNIPIYLHPTIPIIPQLLTYGWGLAGAAFGFGTETSLVMMRLIISGAFDAFPKLKIILGHYGEGFPFMINRVDRPFLQGHVRTNPKVAPTLKSMPSAYLMNNMLVSTSGNYSADAFLCTKNALGVERMVLGTDYPFEDMAECMGFLAEQPLSREERELLDSGTAIRLGMGAA
jgi:predicted TIM-barrel fold metal-dependent hydrolase